MELKKIVINKRSGYIHTRDCESIKQMKDENKKVLAVPTVDQLEKAKACRHCLKKRDMRKVYAEEYEIRKKMLEEKRAYEHKEVDYKYEGKLAALKAKFDKKMKRIPDY